MVFPPIFFLCFPFSVFLCLKLYFLHAAWTDMLLLPLLCCARVCVCLFQAARTVQFGKQICAVESNVLLNEMFTLFCDQSSNSASRQTIYLRLPLFPRRIPSLRVSFVISAIFVRFTCAYKTQTHLTGIITRHNYMHHAFRCTCLLFPLFLLSLSSSLPFSSVFRFRSGFIQMRNGWDSSGMQLHMDQRWSWRNKWRRTCLNLPGNNNMTSTSNTRTHTKRPNYLWKYELKSGIFVCLCANWKLL